MELGTADIEGDSLGCDVGQFDTDGLRLGLSEGCYVHVMGLMVIGQVTHVLSRVDIHNIIWKPESPHPSS